MKQRDHYQASEASSSASCQLQQLPRICAPRHRQSACYYGGTARSKPRCHHSILLNCSSNGIFSHIHRVLRESVAGDHKLPRTGPLRRSIVQGLLSAVYTRKMFGPNRSCTRRHHLSLVTKDKSHGYPPMCFRGVALCSSADAGGGGEGAAGI